MLTIINGIHHKIIAVQIIEDLIASFIAIKTNFRTIIQTLTTIFCLNLIKETEKTV